MSFVSKTTTDSKLDSNWTVSKTETLYNSNCDWTLILYSNGYISIDCVPPLSGEYNISNDNRISVNWSNGVSEIGTVQTIRTTSGTRINKVDLAGVRFENTERFVVPRR